MPTYEYECSACGHHFEHFQSMSDKPIRKCPVCKKMKVDRLIGAGAGIIFKGSGFYETDYKRKSGSPSDGGGSSTSSTGSGNTSASDTKAASSPADSAKPAKSSGTGDKS